MTSKPADVITSCGVDEVTNFFFCAGMKYIESAVTVYKIENFQKRRDFKVKLYYPMTSKPVDLITL